MVHVHTAGIANGMLQDLGRVAQVPNKIRAFSFSPVCDCFSVAKTFKFGN